VAAALGLSLVTVLHGEPQARTAPARPAAAPVRPAQPRTTLSAFARSIGFEHTWVTPSKVLRVKSRLNELLFEVDKREVKLNGLRLFMGDAATHGKKTLQVTEIDRDRFLLPILAPQKLPVLQPLKLIALDPGHGGKDRGTHSDPFNLDEKDLTLEVARRLKPMLEARGFRVFLTRTDDTYIPLPERPKLAAAAGADLFVSIHFNAAGPAVRGIETYILTPQYQRSTGSDKFEAADDVRVPGNAHDPWNAHLGYVMHRQLVRDLGLPDRGLKHARFVVIRDLASCPGVLVECGYLSHKDEARTINDPAHREKLAATISAGIGAFNQRLVDLAAARARAATPAK
jgi:N-acetylmuramoyl-L-alanine amidase